jgi:hypothetical protein
MTTRRKNGRSLGAELRKKFSSPREALAALGLDQSLLDIPRKLAFDGANAMKPTILEYLAVTRAARALNPTLATDVKIEYGPIFKGLTSQNFKARKPTIVSDVKRALDGKIRKTLAMDAPMEHLAHLLTEMENVKEPKSLDASVSEEQHKAMEAAAHGKSNLGIPKEVGKEFVEKDTAGSFDRKTFDAWMKGKGASEDSITRVHDMIRDELPENALDEWEDDEDETPAERAEDASAEAEGETEEEKEKREREKAAKDRRTVKDREREAEDRRRAAKDRKGAMDKFITVDAAETIARSAVNAERKRQVENTEARNFCRRYAGELSMALDSAEDIYRATARICGIEEADQIKEPIALRALIKACAPAGARPGNGGGLTHDEAIAGVGDTLSRFPGMGRIGNA